jgi:hypothetical protein
VEETGVAGENHRPVPRYWQTLLHNVAWNDHSDPKGIIGGIDSYNYEKRKIFADERKQEYKDIMEKVPVWYMC